MTSSRIFVLFGYTLSISLKVINKNIMMEKIEHSYPSLKSLQILRAIAAVSVVYYHIGAIPVFGSFGVDIFFVLSGFVMALVINLGQSPKRFAINRVSRIVPLYWVLTTGVLILAMTYPEQLNSTTANVGNYLKSLLFIPYFKENGALNPMLAVGWTLNYEMFFYFSVWLCLVCKYRQLNHVIYFVGFFLISAYFLLGFSKIDSTFTAFFGSSLLFEFLFGMVCFKLYQTGLLKQFKRWQLIISIISCYATMVCAEAFALKLDRVLMYGLPSMLLVLFAVSYESLFAIRSKTASLLCLIGDASYATYLSHFYIVEGIRKIAHQKLSLIDPYEPIGVLVIVSLSLLVGHVIYILIDKPLSSYFKNRFLRRSAVSQIKRTSSA